MATGVQIQPPCSSLLRLAATPSCRREEPKTADTLRVNVRLAAKALAPIAAEHELVVGHGNGPQVGLLALQAAAYARVETYPLDALGAQTEEMIGYMLEQELGNLLPFERPLATVQTMVEVDPDDPAFKNPTRFIGPVYLRDEAERLTRDKGWVFKPDGNKWRRVVASPEPKRIFELPAHQVFARAQHDCHRGRRRRHSRHESECRGSQAGGSRVRHRQRHGVGVARARAGRRRVCDAHRRRRRLRRLGHAHAESDQARFAGRFEGDIVRGGIDGAEGGRGVPLRHVNWKDGRDRCARRSCPDHCWTGRHDDLRVRSRPHLRTGQRIVS